ncbi:HAMP domain-containing methyl-accepting chemotaxis protein [Falsiroseomonas sp.]|uniref:HAMP domain-containing methyl-accepting chemotaxis protein n=1 Tax=Falsiroseomonas sp. TaxID=2870721 RepID=UPI002734C885|nr:HAMP domain-containing methyl-accepting chemotaxis protein [Falsiroseomonas sp.]MDP3416968.1 HAMP domain-containing methyl-accepting chemotaxis protein [Falsiroseomonas sp.]
MRFLLDLSVGRKLAASAALTLLLLSGLVVLVWQETSGITTAQVNSARIQGAMDRMDQNADRLREVAVLERDLLLTHDEAGQAPAWAAVENAIRASVTGAQDAARSAGSSRVAEAATALTQAAEGYRAALEVVAQLRLQMILARDKELFPLSSEYDSLFEAVSASFGFDLPADQQDDARHRLLTVHGAVNDVRIGVQRLLATSDEAQLRRVRRGIAQARVHSRGLTAIEAPARLQEDANRLAERAQGIGVAAAKILDAGEAIEKARREGVAAARTRLDDAIQALVTAGGEVATEQRALVMQRAETVRDAVIWAGGAIGLVLLLSSFGMARGIGAPMRRLSAVMARIAGGEAAVAVPDRGRRDEIGQMAEALEGLRATVNRAFAQGQMIEQLPAAVMSADPNDNFRMTYMNAESNRLMESLRRVLPVAPDAMLGQSMDVFHRNPEAQRAVLSDPSRLPHTARINLGNEVLELRVSAIRDAGGNYSAAMLTWNLVTEQVRLADTFETEVGAVVAAVAESAARLQQSAISLSGTAATSGEEAAAVAAAGGQAQGDVQAVAAAAEEMASSVSEISRQVGEAAQVASRAVVETRATDATVQGLSEAAARIGDVVRLIGDIAGQTNLLALNATIEAARAGEAGKGFAVVASEVKSLAGQTAKATEEIAAQIGQMQQATSQAVAAIRGIGATVERTSEIATAIAAAVEEQGAATQEIARSASQVADATQTVAQRIEGVRGAAEATGTAASAMRDDSGALASQATQLRQKTDSFLRAVRSM